MALAAFLYGFAAASDLCSIGGNTCDNWTNHKEIISVVYVLIFLFVSLGVVLLVKDLYLNSSYSKSRKIAFTLSLASIVLVPYSIIITPVLFLLTLFFTK